MEEWDIGFELQSNPAPLRGYWESWSTLKQRRVWTRQRTIKNQKTDKELADLKQPKLFTTQQLISLSKDLSQISNFLARQLGTIFVFSCVPWLETSVWTAINLKAWTVPLCYAPNNCAQCWTTDSWQRCAKRRVKSCKLWPRSGVETMFTPRDERSSQEQRGKSHLDGLLEFKRDSLCNTLQSANPLLHKPVCERKALSKQESFSRHM